MTAAIYARGRELTMDRLRAIVIVAWACQWRHMEHCARRALRGSLRARLRLAKMLGGLEVRR